MIEFICLFFPALVSLSVLERIGKKKEYVEKIYSYAIYNIMINIIGLLVVSYFNDFSVVMLDASTFTILFSLKYLVLTSVIAFVLPYAINYVKKNLKIEIKREKVK